MALLVLGCSADVAADGLNGPEAVRYDPELDIFFVSNFNEEPAGDSNGFVSKLSPGGEVIVAKFMVGTEDRPFHGGRGMFIDQSGLWVVDALGVHLFDRESGEQLDFVDLSEFEPGFPNDIVLGKDGALYVTDTGTASLYRIVDRDASLVTKVPMNPNGITADPETGRLLWLPGVVGARSSRGTSTRSASRQLGSLRAAAILTALKSSGIRSLSQARRIPVCTLWSMV